MEQQLNNKESEFFEKLATLLATYDARLMAPILPGDNIEVQIEDNYFTLTVSYDDYYQDRVLVVRRKLTEYIKIKGTK